MKKFQYRGTKRWKIQKKGKIHGGWNENIYHICKLSFRKKQRSCKMRAIFIDAMAGVFSRTYKRYKAS